LCAVVEDVRTFFSQDDLAVTDLITWLKKLDELLVEADPKKSAL
jgi:hypothetical protein